ncbi:hypothetical protein Patl1_19018 [Pistacia atlantica]|uniref:Uncharacterized protein n=1 Tax=Pistacia atlantica TaxID=434234 RepID=A0ACC1C0M3_9ROSI|nr:hypothetical protein Patl1_19018 [Pistacia atlantica]
MLGFVAVSCAAYIQFNGGTIFQKALEVPLLMTGLVLVVVLLLGLIGSCCRANGVYQGLVFNTVGLLQATDVYRLEAKNATFWVMPEGGPKANVEIFGCIQYLCGDHREHDVLHCASVAAAMYDRDYCKWRNKQLSKRRYDMTAIHARLTFPNLSGKT